MYVAIDDYTLQQNTSKTLTIAHVMYEKRKYTDHGDDHVYVPF